MKIGIASIFSFRPHVEHMAYLATVLERAGHEVHGLTCDSAVDHCYSRDLRERSRISECSRCMVGGIRSYPISRVWSVDPRHTESLAPERLERLTRSSVATVFRTESASDLAHQEVRDAQEALAPAVEVMYGSAKRWIVARGLDAVLFFNGRMDLTGGLRAACEDTGVPFITVERSWFGHGLLLIPGQNCLGLGEISRLALEFRDRPLTTEQAGYAGRIAADRFRQRNTLEWRLYNAGAQDAQWPTEAPAGERVLILPSSRNEFEAHPDFASGWADYTDAMRGVLGRLGISPRHAVLRCHPNWAERIGVRTGASSERHYTNWARDLGVTVVPSAQKVNTYALMAQSDIVIVNGSSTGVEAGLLGKKVVCVGHATYQTGGFTVQVHGPDEWDALGALAMHDRETTVRRALRYVYTHGRRFTQFVDHVRAITTSRYEYFDGADAGRLVHALRERQLVPDDGHFAADTAAEDRVVAQVMAGAWEELGRWQESLPAAPRLAVRRRLGLRWMDGFRDRLPRGDL